MYDQASTLREVVRASSLQRLDEQIGHQPVAIAITSGKGGVGKTNVVANLAVALAKMGKRVLILDADFGLANIDVLFGLAPKHNMGDFVFGDKALEEIVIEGPNGVKILPATSGIEQMTALTPEQQLKLVRGITALGEHTDYLLIDTAAGISSNVISFLLAAGLVIVVTEPEPTAIVDAYLMVKILAHREAAKKIYILVNNVVGRDEANSVFRQIDKVSNRFLNKQVELLGFVERDKNLMEAVAQQMPVVNMAPNTPAARCLTSIARKLNQLCNRKKEEQRVSMSWEELFEPANPYVGTGTDN
jgi:flagellar biosynthesis protein FlhG